MNGPEVTLIRSIRKGDHDGGMNNDSAPYENYCGAVVSAAKEPEFRGIRRRYPLPEADTTNTRTEYLDRAWQDN